MGYRPTWWSKSGVFLFSIVLAGIVVNLFFETPNKTYGGELMLFALIALAVIFKAIIEYFLSR